MRTSRAKCVPMLAWLLPSLAGCGLVVDYDPPPTVVGVDAGARDASLDASVTPPPGPFASCAELLAASPGLPDGAYTVVVNGVETTVECDMTSDGGGWTRALELAPLADGCPEGWDLDAALGGCFVDRPACDGEQRSFSIASPIDEWTEVRGYVRAIMKQTPDAFDPSGLLTIDDLYVDGVSITTGSPRRHLWTFAAGLNKPTGRSGNSCPCDNGPMPPSFVGTRWTCETGNDLPTFVNEPIWYVDDVLWDADGDAHGDGCAPVTEPGWFVSSLDAATSDPIEVRILFDQCDDNILVTDLRLYVR